FALRGYDVIGFDVSQPALSYLRRGLKRRRLFAETFAGEMSEFQIDRQTDAAYCLINTFRHLVTEEAASAHLACIARSVRPGGVYILGVDVLRLNGYRGEVERWTQRRGNTQVTVTQRVLRTNVR